MKEHREPWPHELLVERLPLSVRTANCLRDAGIKTVGELEQWSDSQLLRLDSFGRKSLSELRLVISEGRPSRSRDEVEALQGEVEKLKLENAMWRGKYEGAIEALKSVGLRLKEAI